MMLNWGLNEVLAGDEPTMLRDLVALIQACDPDVLEGHKRRIINTIKATALAILFCLGIGGIFGSVIFARRRAQAALREQYTDAGGMVRLNLDELAAQPVPSRLLPPGDD